jgi:hypothetical protein
MNAVAKAVEVRIRASFQYFMNAMTNAATNVETEVRARATFSDIPSWTRFVSEVICVTISPAPS